jgi:rhodanese-related sulfurtransferase
VVQQVTVRELAQLQANGQPVYLLDVRQPWEHEIAALPGSQLIPLLELPVRIDEVKPPEGALVVVYCHHGIRSLHGAGLLAEHGLARVSSLAGGIEAWAQQVDPQVPRY